MEVNASSGMGERYRASRRAVSPVIVKATSARAPTIAPTSAAARAMAPPVVVGILVSEDAGRSRSASAAQMTRDMVATASAGYSPTLAARAVWSIPL